MQDRAAAFKAESESTLTSDTITPESGEVDEDEEIDSLKAWRALVDGKSSIVDQFERDGRRFLVLGAPSCAVAGAQHDPAAMACRMPLSSRERRVLAYAVRGHSNKLIAYELRLSQSTVSTILRGVATRVGARSRVELIRLLATTPNAHVPALT